MIGRRRKPVTTDEARLKMAGLCARAEHCESEVREKLYRMGIDRDVREDIIVYLVENHYIDHTRFAGAYARDKMRFSGWGRKKIRLGLMQKRISSEIIREALDALDEKEYTSVLRRVAESRASRLDLAERDDRIAFYRYLLSRGFESEFVSKIIKSLLRRNDEEEQCS